MVLHSKDVMIPTLRDPYYKTCFFMMMLCKNVIVTYFQLSLIFQGKI
jgi:hypothetical protein